MVIIATGCRTDPPPPQPLRSGPYDGEVSNVEEGSNPASLNPAQREVIALLGRSAEDIERTAMPDGIGALLLEELEKSLEPLADELSPDSPLWVSKHALSTVHSCEAHHLAGQGSFEWSPATVRGTVAHRAIEIGIHVRGTPTPAELVDETIARLVDDTRAPASQYLASLGEYDRAEVRGLAVEHVTAFQECFPPLKAAWIPRTESKVQVSLLGGRIMLSGKVDLTLGRPGAKVIIDLKSGRYAVAHRDDLRFYALIETIKMGVPPRKLASYYLDQARTHPEDVTEPLLRSATRRTIDGIMRMYAITRANQEPVRRPGAQCRWCPIADDCEVGQAFLTAQSDDS